MEEDWLSYFLHLLLDFKLLGFVVYLSTLYIMERNLTNSKFKTIAIFGILIFEVIILGFGEIYASGLGDSYFK